MGDIFDALGFAASWRSRWTILLPRFFMYGHGRGMSGLSA